MVLAVPILRAPEEVTPSESYAKRLGEPVLQESCMLLRVHRSRAEPAGGLVLKSTLVGLVAVVAAAVGT